MMKKLNIFTLGMALVAGLSSCEMADEMRGNGSSTETGSLELSVAVAQTESRADTGSSISTDNFDVVITNTENAENTYTYTYSELPKPLTLPTGTYTVSASTEGDIQTQMSAPYYEGTETLTITNGVTSQVEVVCKMANTKIDMGYSDDFKSMFQSWTINIDDGDSHVITFSNENVNDTIVYWHLGDNVTTMTMNIEATTTDGTKITDQKQFTKADADQSYGDDSDNFTGGDVLNINIDIRPQIGFIINVDITFSDTNETVEIPVEDVPTEPEEPGDENAPTMQMPSDGNIVYTLNGSDQPASADVIISAPNGLKSMIVKIVAGNDDFAKTIADLSGTLDFVNGAEMVGNELIGSILGAFLGGASVSAPGVGDTSYTFPVGAFFNLMNIYGATAPNAHSFQITLEDQKGNKVEDELRVTINPAAE